MKIPFSEQIKGVPPEMVAQGCRLQPSEEVLDAWRKDDGNVFQGWEVYHILHTDKKWVDAYRPVKSRYTTAEHDGICVYDHSGWGDGLAPTIETVDIWPSWWLRDPRGELEVCRVRVYDDRDMKTADYWIGDQVAFYDNIAEWGTWCGPVLPPAGSL